MWDNLFSSAVNDAGKGHPAPQDLSSLQLVLRQKTDQALVKPVVPLRLVPEDQRNGTGLPEFPQQVGYCKFHMAYPDIDAHRPAGLRTEAEQLGLSPTVGLGRAALFQDTGLHQLCDILKGGRHTQGQRP